MPTPAYQVRHIGLAEGLDNMRVFSILQDRNDVMWIATKNGVNRYNGCVMKVYQLSSDRVYSNAAGRIFSLRQDANGFVTISNSMICISTGTTGCGWRPATVSIAMTMATCRSQDLHRKST